MSGGAGSGRFVKGVSGNPKGRPRKPQQPVVSAFDIVIDRTLTIRQGGIPREVTVDEALQHKTYQDAVSGSRAARREILKMIDKRERARASKAPPARAVEIRKQHAVRDVNAALEILQVALPDHEGEARNPSYPHMLLEPWAVKAALKRRRGSELTDWQLSEVRRCTRAPDSIPALKRDRP